MSLYTKSNFGYSSLASSITDSDTSLTVATGEGAKFPSSGSFVCAIWGSSYSSPILDSTREIIIVTARSTDTFTITRAAESTSAKAWGAGSKIGNILTAGTLAQFESIDWASPVAVNTATTLTIGRHHVISDLASPANYTVTLPAASGNSGKLLSIEMSGSLTKLVTVDGNASELIDGQQTRVMWTRETAILLCDGTGWTKIGGKSIPFVCKIGLTNTQTNVARITFTKTLMDMTYTDNGSLFSLSDNGIVIKRAGTYNVVAQGYSVASVSPITRLITMVYKNGAQCGISNQTAPTSVVGAEVGCPALGVEALNVGDILQHYTYNNASNGTFSLTNSLNFLFIAEVVTW